MERELSVDEKKEYLSGYMKAKRKEQRILDKIQQLRMDKMFPGIRYSDMPGGSNMSDLSDFAVKMEELMQELKSQMEECAAIRREIIQKIECLSDETEKLILRLRYIQLKSWEEIQNRTEVSCLRRVFRIHGRALNHFNVSA